MVGLGGINDGLHEKYNHFLAREKVLRTGSIQNQLFTRQKNVLGDKAPSLLEETMLAFSRINMGFCNSETGSIIFDPRKRWYFSWKLTFSLIRRWFSHPTPLLLSGPGRAKTIFILFLIRAICFPNASFFPEKLFVFGCLAKGCTTLCPRKDGIPHETFFSHVLSYPKPFFPREKFFVFCRRAGPTCYHLGLGFPFKFGPSYFH